MRSVYIYIYIYIYIYLAQKKLPKWLRNICKMNKKNVFLIILENIFIYIHIHIYIYITPLSNLLPQMTKSIKIIYIYN